MKRWQPVVTLVLVAGLLAACSKDISAGDNRSAPIKAGDQYVALGDSYTSAPALGSDSGAQGCQQTTGNYPHLVAEELELELIDVSCGGATTDSMTSSQRPLGGSKVPPQLDAVTEDTDLVTLSIGANNEGVYGNLVVACARLAVGDPTGAPCSALAEANPKKLPRVFDEVADAIVKTVGEILDRAPDARVVIVGYPQIVPAVGSCPELPLGAGDYPFGREVIAQFVRSQEKAAKEVDAEYVDVWSATEGHDICADEPWIAGVKPETGRAATPYHPYAEEQQVVADLLVARVSGK